MLTCYIKNDFESDNVKMYSILILPLFYIINTIFLFVKLYNTRAAIKISESRNEILKFLTYSLFYAVFYFPTIILYIITIGKTVISPTNISWFAYFCYISNISMNLGLSVLRIFQGHVSINIISPDFDNHSSRVSFLNDSCVTDISYSSHSINYLEKNKINSEEKINNHEKIEISNEKIEEEIFTSKILQQTRSTIPKRSKIIFLIFKNLLISREDLYIAYILKIPI